MKKHLPNLITLINLFCGINASLLWLNDDQNLALYFIIIAALADFLDGFVARMLNVSSEVGKQLDSLCDLVSFGVFPSIVIYQFLAGNHPIEEGINVYAVPAFIIAMGAAYRLAKFNLDNRQTEDFIGLNTPSMTIFVLGLYFIIDQNTFGLKNILLNDFFLYGICGILVFLMNAEINLFGLKVKNFGWKGNELKIIVLTVSIALVATIGFQSLSFIILFYIILSVLFHRDKVLTKES